MTAIFVLLSAVNASVFAVAEKTMLFVDNVTVDKGEEIKVAVKVSNNKGICGAAVSVRYDSALTLTGITKGNALPSLTMTKPGNLAANPFNIVFDGVEEDTTDGVIAYLFFDSMSEGGDYNVSISYEYGDIVNGALEPVEVETVSGTISVADASGGGGGDDPLPFDGTVITIGEVTANSGESVDVPVYISGNTGICGAAFKITYDSSLVLTQITKGDGLPSLTMTKPGNLTANPFNLVFDGIEQDNGNGLLFTMTFTAPQNSGTYDIAASYDVGDIVDGELSPVEVSIKNGGIAVGDVTREITVGGETIILPPIDEEQGNIFVALYDETDKLTSVHIYELNTTKINVDADVNAVSSKIMCWSDNMRTLCDAKQIILK